jgi:phage-related protein (TIGR01555 family)
MSKKSFNLFRLDGWQKLLSGFGLRKDKSSENAIPGFERLVPIELESTYYADGRVKNAVNMPAESMVQEGFEVTGDDGALYSAFQELNGPDIFKQALVWTRMLGGALIIMDVEGGGSWEEPWYPEKGGRVRSLRVYPQTRVELGLMEISKIPESIYFEDFEKFVVRKLDGMTFTVHASRCLILKSTLRVDQAFPGWLDYERYWGLSAIYEGLEDAKNFTMTTKGTSHLMQECSVGKYKLSNLEQLVAESDYKSIETRLEAMDMQKSVINGIFLGEGEDYKRENMTFVGVPEMWDRQMMTVAGSYRIPVTKLFGRSAAGMNATGEGDDDNYNSYIAGLQKSQLLPPIKKLMTCLNYEIKAVKSENSKPPKIVIEFNPLSKRDQLKDAQIRETMSRADRNYVEAGILDSNEIVRNRFQGGFTIDTTVEDDYVPDLSKDPEE